MPSASTAYPCATRNCSPYTDEYHVTSSDFTKMITNAVIKITYNKIDGPERFSNRTRHLSKLAGVPASGSLSRCTDQRFSSQITSAIQPSTIAAPTITDVGFSIGLFEFAVSFFSCVINPCLYACRVATAFGYAAH